MAEEDTGLDKLQEPDTGTSSRQRLIIIVGASAGLVVVLLLALFFMLRSGTSTEPLPRGVARPAASTDTTEPAAPASPGQPAGGVSESFDVYETRDPFKSMETSSTTTSAGSSLGTGGSSTIATASATGTAGSTGTQVLALESTFQQDGDYHGRFRYGSATYELKAGDRVADSPYQVISVAADSATLLYGDDQIRLGVGQEIYK